MNYFPLGYDSTHHNTTEWTFINLLPLTIKLYVGSVGEKLRYLFQLSAFGKITYDTTKKPVKLQNGDVIHVASEMKYSSTKYGSDFGLEIIRPENLRGDSCFVYIGNIVYNWKNNSNYFNIHTDISGLHIHNRLAVPIDIYWTPKQRSSKLKLAQVDLDDGLDFMISKSHVYVDNDNNGFKLGDKLSFVLRNEKLQYAEITLDDNYMSDIFVGVIDQKENKLPYDIYSYTFENDLKYPPIQRV